MSQPGIGAMLHYLSGGNKNDPAKYYGKTISSIEMKNDMLIITFTDGIFIRILDDGQSCCESRYMETDDDLSSHVGEVLTKIEAKLADDIPDDYGVHEAVFIEFTTNKGHFQICNHNEHNGYYGGFGLVILEGDQKGWRAEWDTNPP